MARTTPGVKLVDNLASFTDAYGTHKNFNKTAKKIKENPFADSGSLGEYKYFSRDKKTGSSQWKGLLDDANPDVSTNKFYRDAKTFTRPDETGFSPSDDAYAKWENFAFVPFQPGNKVGALADRIDTPDVQAFYDTYTNSRLIGPETYVGSSNLAYMFEMPANEGSTENNPNEANVSPSKGIAV